jgi:galactokinase
MPSSPNHSRSHTRTFRAPGRVNLIGEYTDFNDGFVVPMAIDRYTYVTAEPLEGPTVIAWSDDLAQGATIEGANTPTGAPDWAASLRGVIALLRQRGLARLGARLLIRSQIPLRGGLSSSASFEVVCAYALLAINGESLSGPELAKVAWQSENEYAGVRCGIMDQFIVANAAPGAALLLDCRSLESRPVPLPPGVEVAVVNTMVKRELGTSAYNTRRAECDEAARLLGVKSLRDANLAAALTLPEPMRRRAKHVIEENARVMAFLEALPRADWDVVGRAMAGSHAGLRDEFEVSCPELDFLAEKGRELGSWGSRMTGGGFGGCTVHFVRAGSGDAFLRELCAAYKAQFNIDAQGFICHPGHAVEEVRP